MSAPGQMSGAGECHRIWNSRVAVRGVPAWHKLGWVADADDADFRPVPATQKVKMDYEVETTPMLTVFNERLMVAGGDRVLVRQPVDDDPEPRIFGHCGPDYTVLQNMDLARILERLCDTSQPGHMKLETLAALHFGRVVFYTLRSGESMVGNEHIDDYFLITNDHGGGKSLVACDTKVRVVCQNTLTWGLSSAKNRISIPHTQAIQAETEFYTDLFAGMRRAKEISQAQLDRLAAFKVTQVQAEKIFDAAYPIPAQPQKAAIASAMGDGVKNLSTSVQAQLAESQRDWERIRERMKLLRGAAAVGLEALSDENPQLGGTAWLALNAVTDLADWLPAGPRSDAVAVAEDLLFGGRASQKSRALEAATALK